MQARLVAHPLTLHGALYTSAASYLSLGKASYTPSWLTASLPPSVLLHSMTTRDAPYYPPAPNSSAVSPASAAAAPATGTATLGLRLQQLPHGEPASVDLATWLGELGVVSATETTLDFNLDKAAADDKRLKWLILGGSGSTSARPAAAPSITTPVAAFDAEFVRAYVVTVNV